MFNPANATPASLTIIGRDTPVSVFITSMDTTEATVMLCESAESFNFQFADEDQEDGQIRSIEFIISDSVLQDMTTEYTMVRKNVIMSSLTHQVRETFKQIVDMCPEDESSLIDELMARLHPISS